MTTQEMVDRLRDIKLNRPENDPFYTDPDDYEAALTDAHARVRRKIAEHYPALLQEVTTVSADDSDGDTYTLSDDHLGELQVWAPPGPPNGTVVLPGFPEYAGNEQRYWMEGRELNLTRPKVYTPGLYIVWVPAANVTLDVSDQDSTLPSYCDELILADAARRLAKKPGSLLDPDVFRAEFNEAWSGDPQDPSDMGVLRILSRQDAHQGYMTAASQPPAPWWRGISG